MAKQKPIGTEDEIIALFYLKRERAREAMCKIVMASSQDSCWQNPSTIDLLDYISNMVPCLELMAKLLSGNTSDHNVGEMYQNHFQKPHPCPDFMEHLQMAMRDQKYFFHPVADATDPANTRKPFGVAEILKGEDLAPDTRTTIAHYIPEMEGLFAEFLGKLKKRYEAGAVPTFIHLPLAVGRYLQQNVGRFYTMDGVTVDSQNPRSKEEVQKLMADHGPEYDRRVKEAEARIRDYLDSEGKVTIEEGSRFILQYLR